MKDNVNVDLMGNVGSQGELANHTKSNGLNVGMLRPYIGSDGNAYVTAYIGGNPKSPKSYVTKKLNTNATLRRDEWKVLDEAILDVSRSRLGGVQDLIDKNLTYNLGNAMGTTVLESHDVSDAMEAELSMDGLTRTKNDRPDFQHTYLPIPIIHVDYEINSRVLEASRRMGNPLDTTSAERAARKVNEKLEAMLFTNITYSFGEADSRSRNTIYSYINHPDRNTVTLSTAWDGSGKTAAQIVADVFSMKASLIAKKKYGPYMIYIPTEYDLVLDEDYDTSGKSTQTVRERIMKIEGIQGIKVIDTLPDDNVLMVEMKKDTIRLVRGLGLQNVQWKSEGQFMTNYKVLTIQVPQIRSDYDGNCGIAHLA